MPGFADHQTRVLAHLALGAAETIDEMAGSLTLTTREVSSAAGKLILRGFAERLERGVYQATSEGLQAHASGERLASGPRGPIGKPRRTARNTIRQRAWAAMRVLRRFTVADLAVAAGRRGEPDPSDNIGAYLSALARSGVLALSPFRADDGKPTSNGLCVYRLVSDRGDVAPIWRRADGLIVIPETGEQLPCR